LLATLQCTPAPVLWLSVFFFLFCFQSISWIRCRSKGDCKSFALSYRQSDVNIMPSGERSTAVVSLTTPLIPISLGRRTSKGSLQHANKALSNWLLKSHFRKTIWDVFKYMMTDFSPRTYAQSCIITTTAGCWWSMLRCCRTANYAFLEVEVLLPAGGDAGWIVELTGLTKQVTYSYCCHLLQWAETEPLKTVAPYKETLEIWLVD
jgi:phosphatidylglycerophosphate synthase